MQDTVNIIVPAIEINNELLKCLKEINKINYSKFITTIVLDRDSNRKLPKLKYKLKKLVVGKINMSKKRNIAAKKFKSKYIAFIDSDAYPNKKWLKLAAKYLKQGIADVIGGPGIPFPNEEYKEKICYLSKRSYFVTGYLSFRKYKAKKRYCDWLEACNLIMERNFFLKYKGMDENRYTGEDKEFFERVRRKKPDLKVFYSPDLFIYHKERRMFGFFLQRFVFGVDFLNLIKFNSGLNGLQPILPMVVLIFFFVILISDIQSNNKLLILTSFVLVINFLILLDIKRYIKSLKTIIYTLVTINLANVAFAVGSVTSLIFFSFKKFLVNKIYLFSRNKKKTFRG